MTIELEIKSLDCSNKDLETWRPADEDVFFVLDLEIGEKGDPRADLFYVTVATPAGLLQHRSTETTRPGPLILQNFSMPELRQRIDEILAKCCAETWEKSATLLQEHFEYEYADYHPG